MIGLAAFADHLELAPEQHEPLARLMERAAGALADERSAAGSVFRARPVDARCGKNPAAQRGGPLRPGEFARRPGQRGCRQLRIWRNGCAKRSAIIGADRN